MRPTPDWRLPDGVDRGLWDYMHGRELAAEYDAQMSAAPLAALDVAFAEEHFGPPGRLIDLGCGTGRLLDRFAARGFRCTGVDLSHEMLARATPTHGLVRDNLTDLASVRDGVFDYAACLFSTLGMVAGSHHRRRALRSVHRILRPGGVFVLHAHNRDRQLALRGGRLWWLRDRLRAVAGSPRAGGRTMPQHYAGAALTLHLFGRSELRRGLAAAGFLVKEIRPIRARLDRPPGVVRWLPSLRACGFMAAAVKPE